MSMHKGKRLNGSLSTLLKRFALSLGTTLVLVGVLCSMRVYAAAPEVTLNLASGSASGGTLGTLELLFLMVIIALAPSILVMMTSFTRIVIVLSFLRNAMGTQQSPPNQIIVGLALFLTLFIMRPVMNEIRTEAYEPFQQGIVTQEEAVSRAVTPLKRFMLKQTDTKDLSLFVVIAHDRQETPEEAAAPDNPTAILTAAQEDPEKLMALGLEIVIPSFITSEMRKAFEIGFLLFIPFLIIDVVVSSTLMSMGMVMLPPSMIALPFKLMMFVLVDGWGQLFGTLVKGFR